MKTQRQETLAEVQREMNDSGSIFSIKADGLTIGEAFFLFKEQEKVYRARMNMARLIEKFRDKEESYPLSAVVAR